MIAPGPKQIDYRYDAAGNRIGMTDPDGGRFTYAYDGAGRNESVRNPQNDRTTFAYDDAGRRTLKQIANGTRASFSYDDANQLAKVFDFTSVGTIISGFDYGYDDAGNRTRVIETNGDRVTWTYDPANQLLGEQRSGANDYAQTYAYDPAGNRTLKNIDGGRTTYAYDDANQLETAKDSSGTTTYTFDNDGNQQTVLAPNGDLTTNTWDFENRNTAVLNTVILPPGVSVSLYAYDPDGLRVEKNVNAAITKFVWDEQNYLLETNAAGMTTITYTNEPQIYGNLISHRQAGATRFYHFDALGSTRAITNAAETTTDAFLYDAWGDVINRTGTTYTPFQWIGELGYYVDPETGLIYVRTRLYRPPVATWMSLDIIGFVDGAGRYHYASSSPLTFTDPSGMVKVKCRCLCTSSQGGHYTELNVSTYAEVEIASTVGEKCRHACGNLTPYPCKYLGEYEIAGAAPSPVPKCDFSGCLAEYAEWMAYAVPCFSAIPSCLSICWLGTPVACIGCITAAPGATITVCRKAREAFDKLMKCAMKSQ